MPSYYAPGTYKRSGQLAGNGMTLIPSDAIVLFSSSNDAPLVWRYRQGAEYYAPINIVNDEEVQFESIEVQYAVPIYASAIVSEDRQTVYWINNTRPLP